MLVIFLYHKFRREPKVCHISKNKNDIAYEHAVANETTNRYVYADTKWVLHYKINVIFIFTGRNVTFMNVNVRILIV